MGWLTEQENFWAGEFGDSYTNRNIGEQQLSSNIALFSRILGGEIKSCLELGSNRGLNLMALKAIVPDIQMQAVEINSKAAEECSKIQNVKVFNGSLFDFAVEKEQYDLTFTKGVLIHINPNKLNDVYSILYKASKRYIMIAEYYNPTPVEVIYRGNKGKLFKRDFAGEILDKYKDLRLIDYGFAYHRDNMFPADDLTWFLMEKR